MAKPEIRKQARELRRQGMSIGTIALQLEVSKSSVSRWVSHIELSDIQVTQLSANQKVKGLSKGTQALKEITLQERIAAQNEGRIAAKQGRSQHQMGCMLYWAEGTKDRNRLEFVNSDAHMMKLFMKFLTQELHVDNAQVKLRVHCHTNDPKQIEKIESYWLELLELPQESLRKTFVKAGSSSRSNRLEYGVCGIRVDNTRLVQHIYGAIQEYVGFENEDWLF